MVVYGVALLAFCVLVGQFTGDLLGIALGVKANVGGVGIAMLLLIWFSHLGAERLRPGSPSGTGVAFWSAMYIPVIVAMAASQNVVSAVSAGVVALTAGVLAVAASFVLIPVLSGRRTTPSSPPQGGERRDA